MQRVALLILEHVEENLPGMKGFIVSISLIFRCQVLRLRDVEL